LLSIEGLKVRLWRKRNKVRVILLVMLERSEASGEEGISLFTHPTPDASSSACGGLLQHDDDI
jgi:hypothetical protein